MSRFTSSVRGMRTDKRVLSRPEFQLGVVTPDHCMDIEQSRLRCESVLRFHAGVTLELSVDDSIDKNERLYAYEKAMREINEFVYGDIIDECRVLMRMIYESGTRSMEPMDQLKKIMQMMRE